MLFTDGLVETSDRDIVEGIDRLTGEADRYVAGGFHGAAWHLIEAVAKGLDPKEAKVSDIATSKVVTVEVTDDAETVAKVLADNQIRRVPVVDGGKVVGVIAQADVAQELDDQVVAETVDESSLD